MGKCEKSRVTETPPCDQGTASKGAGLFSRASFPWLPSLLPALLPGCLLLGVMSETLIMSDCDTDSPDIHNKETRRREGKRDLGEGGGEAVETLFFFPLGP